MIHRIFFLYAQRNDSKRGTSQFVSSPATTLPWIMRVTRWTLLGVVLAVSVSADVAFADNKDAACIAPSVVISLKTEIKDLKRSNEELQRQVDSRDKEKTQLLANVAQEHEIVAAKLQTEIAGLQKDVKSEKDAVKMAKAELESTLEKLNSESKRAASYDSDIKELEVSLAKEKAEAAETNAELKAVLAELAKQTNKVAQLEKSYESMQKKNKALLKDLSDTKSVELSMASLLSSYYDDTMVLAEDLATFAQQKLDGQKDTLDHVQGHFETAKNAAWDTSSKFYQENLAATLDPILVDVHKTVHPHAKKYLAIAQNEGAKAKQLVVMYSQQALRRAKQARIEAIALLEQNQHVAQYAQKIIDGILIVLAAPMALFQVRLALRLAWWLLTTTLYILTCGLCFGSRERTRTKAKFVKKADSINGSEASSTDSGAKKTFERTPVVQKRGKKGKN